MKKILIVLLALIAISFAFCSTGGGDTTGGGDVAVTDNPTEWDSYFEPETPVIFNNIWPTDSTDYYYCIVILDVVYDTVEDVEAVRIDMTALQDATVTGNAMAWAYNKKDISLRQDADGDGKSEKFKCITGDPIEMVKGQHQSVTDVADLAAGAELFKWKVWFEKTNKDGFVFDNMKPFDFIENCSPGCSKFKDVWVQGG